MAKKEIGICALCQEERELVRSHILPQLLYKHAFEEDDRIIGIGSVPDQYQPFYYSGIWKYLLCDHCDGKVIGPWEDYFEKKVLAPSDHVQKCGAGRLEIRNLDYPKVKLFLLSLLWRMSVTSRREFSSVKLDTEDEERIRQRLINEDPGPPHHFACLLLTNPNFATAISKSFLAPSLRKTQGKEVIMFGIGPFLWSFFLSRKPAQPVMKNLAYLTADGTLPFFLESKTTGSFLVSVWSELNASGNVERALARLKK